MARAVRTKGSPIGLGPWLQVAASLLWIPIAWQVAGAVAGMAAGPGAGLPTTAALVFALAAARAVLDAAGARAAFLAARRDLSRRRALAAAALAARSPLDPDRAPSGQVASVLAEQAEAIVPFIARYGTARLRVSVVPLAMLAAVLPVSWVAALILLAAGPVIPVFMALVGWRAREASRRQLDEVGDMNAFLLDRLRGLATIRGLGAVDRVALRLRAEADGVRRRTMAVLRIAFLSSAVLELFSALGVAMVAVYVGFHLLGTYSFGTFSGDLGLAGGLFVLLLAPAFFEPLRELASTWHDRAAGEEALAAVERVGAPGRLALSGSDDAAVVPTRHLRPPAIEVDAVRFAYPNAERPVLDAFDLRVAPGEHVALLAPSGGGKSTLLALLAGLAAPAAGTIRIDGQPLDAAGASTARSRMAWIGQNPHIFPGSLAANVRLGRAGLDDARVDAALDAVGLASLRDTRRGADLGESGLGISGGEALRLALARAFASPDADLLLADEPTAHLDAATAAQVTDALLRLGRGRTMIVATHDPALAARMDRVVYLGSASCAPAVEDAA